MKYPRVKLARAKLARTTGALGLVTIAIIASPFAGADDSEWYGGASVGQSRSKIDDARITNNLVGGPTSITHDSNDTGYKIFGGYQASKNFALEAGYFDLGKFGFVATTPAGTLNGNIKLKGLNLDTIGILPITEKFSAFGRIGITYVDAQDSFSGPASASLLDTNPSKRRENYKYGLGVQYDFTENLAMRAEAERYRVDNAVGNQEKVDLLSLGLIYRFGEKTVARQTVATAATSQRTVMTPPPAAAPTKVTFSADSLFDFGKATVRPAGKQELDKFAADLKGTDFDVITITGHTDRIGTHAYNMKLSTHRAEAVKTYLVESAGIPAGKITTKGIDGAEPVTKPGECEGKKATKQLIACLQPDRRVEVEVTGTK